MTCVEHFVALFAAAAAVADGISNKFSLQSISNRVSPFSFFYFIFQLAVASLIAIIVIVN